MRGVYGFRLFGFLGGEQKGGSLGFVGSAVYGFQFRLQALGLSG